MKDYTILVPDMCPIHFSLIKYVFDEYGYKIEFLKNEGPSVIEEGLKYVHNDTCYPAMLVIGQMIDALKSGKYDLNKVALLMTQTGGGCRASNYVFLIKKALKRLKYDHIPVLALDLSSLGRSGGFRLTLPMIIKLLVAVTYGDALMLLNNQVLPYEVNKGESQSLVNYWVKHLGAQFKKGKGYLISEIKRNLEEIVQSFERIPRLYEVKPKVGIVGEIYVKYSKLGNNHLEEFLVKEGCEVMVPGLMGFLLYSVNNSIEDVDLYGGSKIKKSLASVVLKYLIMYEEMIIKAVKKFSNFTAPSPFTHLKSLAEEVISRGCKMGEGWLLTAEIVDLVRNGYENVVCAQPFGCLPNHIVGKGMIRKIKSLYPKANIVPIDYDPSATKVNQENRLKLMLAVARENLEIEFNKFGGEKKFSKTNTYLPKLELKTEKSLD